MRARDPPQTRFVLRKALEARLPVVPVRNRTTGRTLVPEAVVNEVYELLHLDADETQIDFPIVYANARAGHAGLKPMSSPDLEPLRETLLATVPPLVRPGSPAASARHEPRCVAVHREAGLAARSARDDPQGRAGRAVPRRRDDREGAGDRALRDRGAGPGPRRGVGPGEIVALAGPPRSRSARRSRTPTIHAPFRSAPWTSRPWR